MAKKTIYRSSVTGRIVKESYAQNHKRTTEKESVKTSRPSQSKPGKKSK